MKIYKIILLILIGLIILFLVIKFGPGIFWRSSLCHEKESDLTIYGSPAIFSSDEKSIYFIVEPAYKSYAVGICAFPDGGYSYFRHRSLDLVKVDLETKEVKWLTTFEEPEGEEIIMTPFSSIDVYTRREINYYPGFYKGQDKFYSRIFGEGRESEYYYLEWDLVNYSVLELSKEIFEDKIKNSLNLTETFINYTSIFNYDYDSQGRYVKSVRNLTYSRYRYYSLFDKDGKETRLFSGIDWLPYDYKLTSS